MPRAGIVCPTAHPSSSQTRHRSSWQSLNLRTSVRPRRRSQRHAQHRQARQYANASRLRAQPHRTGGRLRSALRHRAARGPGWRACHRAISPHCTGMGRRRRPRGHQQPGQCPTCARCPGWRPFQPRPRPRQSGYPNPTGRLRRAHQGRRLGVGRALASWTHGPRLRQPSRPPPCR